MHWFQEHPTFRDGGLVAVAEYENGTRLLQIEPDGKIVEQGYFLPLGGSASARRTGTPTARSSTRSTTRAASTSCATRATRTSRPDGIGDADAGRDAGHRRRQARHATAPRARRAAGFRSVSLKPTGCASSSIGASRRESSRFNVDVFQQSAGSKVIRERLIARFPNKSKSFTWNGKDRKRRRLEQRQLLRPLHDEAQVTAPRTCVASRSAAAAASSARARDFYQRVDCGIFKSLKLTSSVFGGRTKRSLGISYKLALGVNAVNIRVKVGSKTIRKFTGKGTANKTFRFSVPASKVKRGKTVKVQVTPDRGPSPTRTVTLYAKRI